MAEIFSKKIEKPLDSCQALITDWFEDHKAKWRAYWLPPSPGLAKCQVSAANYGAMKTPDGFNSENYEYRRATIKLIKESDDLTRIKVIPEWKPDDFLKDFSGFIQSFETRSNGLSNDDTEEPLTQMEQGIIEVIEILKAEGRKITDEIIAGELLDRGIYNKKEGEAYTRETINRAKKRLENLNKL